MQTILERMISLKQQTETEEQNLQRLFENLLKQLRAQFDHKSNILRADFVELQRQEVEMKQVSEFIKLEIKPADMITSI